jgi:MurNAc alpha-1-phosphate uridylyltransferase
VKVMLLAAGRGERMRPLTDHTPKPLLPVAGLPLLEHHVRRLVSAGLPDLVINVSHLGEKIVDYFGSGGPWGANITWSREEEPLETAGGIINVLDSLGAEPFMVVNGDVWTDFPFERLRQRTPKNLSGAHLVMVGNPAAHPQGDFALADDGLLELVVEGQGEGGGNGDSAVTYSGLGIYSAGFFADVPPGKTPLRPLLERAIKDNCLSGEFYRGQWVDVGTPERLAELNTSLARSAGDL